MFEGHSYANFSLNTRKILEFQTQVKKLNPLGIFKYKYFQYFVAE